MEAPLPSTLPGAEIIDVNADAKMRPEAAKPSSDGISGMEGPAGFYTRTGGENKVGVRGGGVRVNLPLEMSRIWNAKP
jgi:hypothetical protein